MHKTPGKLLAQHGLFAPGVMLLGSVRFPAKAAFVSLAFVLPLAVAIWSLFTTASANIEFTGKELRGTAYARPVLELLQAGVNRRLQVVQGAADLARANGDVSRAMERVSAREDADGSGFGTQATYRELASLHKALLDAPRRESAAATYEAHTSFLKLVDRLLQQVADGSNLTLDPDLETFYMMDAALVRVPKLVDAMGTLRIAGARALTNGQMNTVQRDQVAIGTASTAAALADEQSSVERAIKARNALAAALAPATAFASTRRLVSSATTGLLGEAPSGEPDAFEKAANEAVDEQLKLAYRSVDALEAALGERSQSQQQTLWLQLGIAAVGVLLATYLFIAFYRITRGGLMEMGRHLEQMAAGDLTGKPAIWGRDEAASLARTLGSTIESLRLMVDHVRTAAHEIEASSAEIASASLDLSRRTDDTAIQLQGAASQMQSIDAIAKEAATVASGATTFIHDNGEAASRGAVVIQEAAETMRAIEDASRQISEIIGTIDGIAVQTNLLALNAAVEAARAGEAGRGFNVVAAEVRALSQRTTNAAKQVKTLIDGNRVRVATGSQVVASAGDAMLEIVGNAEKIQSLIVQITRAATDQSKGIAVVEESVRSLDASTQQNAALVEESSATATNLRENASRLAREMAAFKVA